MEERLNRLSNAAAVFAFVMGPPTEPVNDESKALISQLRRLGVLFSCFDMSNAPEVAAALPDHFGGDSSVSAAMLCINGKGFWAWRDEEALLHAVPESSRGLTEAEALHEHCVELTQSAPVVVFIKGTVEKPRCGFTNQILTLLMSRGITFATVDILADEHVRSYMRKFSQWPTYPQLYIDGKFVGGLDVAKELDAEGELLKLVPESAKSKLQ